MKCNYNGCNKGGTVSKDEAVYINKKYYHKECYQSRRIRKRILFLVNKYYNLVDTSKNISIILNKYLLEFDAKYILFVISKKPKLNSINGLKYYLNNPIFINNYKE